MKKTSLRIGAFLLVAIVALGGSALAADAKSKSEGKAKKIEKSQLKQVKKLSSVSKVNIAERIKVKGLGRTIPGKVTELLTVTLPDSANIGQTVTADAFKMKKGNIIYTVILKSDTSVVNRNGVAITKADIVVGHKVSIKGKSLSGNNYQYLATKVRDITLPVETTTSD